LPKNYPNDPPSLKFIDKIYHLNIGYNSGEIRMSILENDWSPFLSLTSLIESLDKLLE
jgi:ubiquitin-protein ligase